MKRLAKFLAAAASLILSFGLLLAVAGYFALGTDTGRSVMREQTERAVARLLGPAYTAELGSQSLELASDGMLAIAWSGVRVMRTGAALPVSDVDRIRVGFPLLPLLAGHFAVDTLEISGANVDLTGGGLTGPEPSSSVEPTSPAAEPEAAAGRDSPEGRFLSGHADAMMAAVERQLSELAKAGVDRVSLSDVGIALPVGAGGRPFVGRIEAAEFDLSTSDAMRMSARLGIDRLSVDVAGNADFDTGKKRLRSLRMSVGPIDLATVIPPGSPDDRTDDRRFATDVKATIALDISTEPTNQARRASLAASIGPGAVQMGKGHSRVEEATLRLLYREGADEVSLEPSLLRFDGFSTSVEGRATPVYAGSGSERFNGFAFDLGARDMRSSVGAAPNSQGPSLAELRIEGRSDLAASLMALDTLELKTISGTLAGNAVLGYGSPDADVRLRLAAAELSANDVKAFWPFNIAPNARRWVLEHVGGSGRFRDAVMAIDLKHDRLGRVFRPGAHPDPNELSLSLTVEDADVSTVGDLPGLLEARGRIDVRGGDTFIALDGAKVAGFDAVTVGPGTVSFVRAPPGALQEIDGTLGFSLAGSASDLLAIAARKPLDALRSIEVKPEDAVGDAKGNVRVDFMLGDEVAKQGELQTYAVSLDLETAGFETPIAGRTIAGMTGPIRITPGSVEGEIAGTVDAIPATIRFTQPYGPEPLGTKALEVDVAVSGEAAQKLVPSLKGIVDGSIAARITAIDGAIGQFSATVDLSSASLQIPLIGWRKGRGVEALLAFDIVQAADKTELHNLTLDGPGFSARGSVTADAAGLRLVDLQSLALNAEDDIRLSAERVSNGFSVRVAGKRYDARPLLNDLKASLGEKAAKPRDGGGKQLDVAIAVDRLIGFGGEELRDFSLDFAGSGAGIAALSISGTDSGGEAFSADLSPRGSDRSISIRAENAGRLAEFSGLYERMDGGAVRLDLLGSRENGYFGNLVAENFTLVDEPRLSSLVSSSPRSDAASLSQAIGTNLRTERAFFDHASAGIAYGNGGLRVSKGIIRGPVFGSSFSGIVYDSRNRIDIVGAFMPAYGLNRIFGDIPLLGQILGNGNEGGLIGITYRLDGAFAAPTLTVNPISAIAPGIFRSIFAYQE